MVNEYPPADWQNFADKKPVAVHADVMLVPSHDTLDTGGGVAATIERSQVAPADAHNGIGISYVDVVTNARISHASLMTHVTHKLRNWAAASESH